MSASEVTEFVFRAVVIGAGATLVMDLWAALLRQLGIPSLSFALLGRWIGHLPEGQLTHERIERAPPVPGERALGWIAHYTIGVAFAALLLATFGLEWAHAPSIGPALLIGLLTVVAPLFALQPALGAGIASTKTPRPLFNALKSIVTHTVYGLGLYLTAFVAAAIHGAGR